MKCNPDDPYHCRYFFDAGIRINGREIKVLAEFLKIPVSDLIRTHLQPIETGFSIAEEADGTCRLYDHGCRIYPVRPLQCRTYPFWFSQMRSIRQWEKTLHQCPGIGNGTLYSRERISRPCFPNPWKISRR